MLPNVKRVVAQPNVFPTVWQAVIFRNYALVPTEALAAILNCGVETVEEEARRLGLRQMPFDGNWRKKGYITLIRNNWFLLPYEQICQLLAISEDRLDFILQNDDFLSVKLGNFKPYCEKVTYEPLTAVQIQETELLAKTVKCYLRPYEVAPFDFFPHQEVEEGGYSYTNGVRIVHGYLAPCGDAFMEDSELYMPEALLQRYAKQGVNGVWMHGTLSTLSPYPFDEALSVDYPTRRKNLQTLINRCAVYGIKVYLYFNEPRGLAENKFGKYSHLIGRRENGYASLCFEQEETREYLYNAVKDLLSNVQGVGGIITITMSENLTHCHYLPHTNCPMCKHIPPEKTAAAVNNVIQKAIRDSGSDTELLANLWGWSPFMEWTEEQTLRGVEMLDKEISVMCVSEYDLDIEKGGVKSRIIDYSISNPGPSEITKKTLRAASLLGHKTYAKIQTNNSWECSAVPYLPVFDLLYEHLCNLSKIGVNDCMLTWTLGGYPSPMLGMVADYMQKREAFSLDEWYQAEYGEEHALVKEAVEHFCKGFKEYPFSVQALYLSPKTLGCANLWPIEAQEKQSTMVCYAYDDYETWTTPYPIDVYFSQYEKLLKEWELGCVLLEKSNQSSVMELAMFAKVAYAHFLSDYLQTKYAYLKRIPTASMDEIKLLARREQENAVRLLNLLYQNACIGFETSNHYFYTDRNLIEKILQMEKLY